MLHKQHVSKMLTGSSTALCRLANIYCHCKAGVHARIGRRRDRAAPEEGWQTEALHRASRCPCMLQSLTGDGTPQELPASAAAPEPAKSQSHVHLGHVCLQCLAWLQPGCRHAVLAPAPAVQDRARLQQGRSCVTRYGAHISSLRSSAAS